MGSETSKPVVETQASQREARGSINEFQIISPVSDISNPSEFRKSYHQAPQGLSGAHDRRRASKVVTKALTQPVRDVPAPSAFYFPTMESEKHSEKVSANRPIPNEKGKRQRNFFRKNKKDKENARQNGRNQQNKSQQAELAPTAKGHRGRASKEAPRAAKREENHGQARGRDRTRQQPEAIGGRQKERISDPEIKKNTSSKARNNMMILEEAPRTETQRDMRSGSSDNRDKRDRQGRQEIKSKRSTESRSKTNQQSVTEGALRKPSTTSSRPFMPRETESLMVPEQKDGSAPLGQTSKGKTFDVEREADESNPMTMPEAYRSFAPRQQPLSNHEATPIHEMENPTAAGLGLHHEDEYFDRLGGDYSASSPYVQNDVAASLALTSALGPSSKVESSSLLESPIHKLFQIDPVLQTSKTGNFEEDAEHESVHTSSSSRLVPSKQGEQESRNHIAPTLGSPVKELLSLQSRGGHPQENALENIKEEPKSLELFTDEATEDSTRDETAVRQHFREILKHAETQEAKQCPVSPESLAASKVSAVTMGTFASEPNRISGEKALVGTKGAHEPAVKDEKEEVDHLQIKSNQTPESPSGHESVDSSEDGTYFKPEEMNSSSAFRSRPSLPEEPIKQIASLGPGLTTAATNKKSKLETLFRPILPALSDSDARQSTGSYDPYEILVTESAPSVIESGNYHSIAYPPQFGSPNLVKGGQSALFSPSMMSVDSQGAGTPSSARPMVSDQASWNAEFLFTADYGKPMLLKHSSRSDRDSGMFSISTIGARSRLSQRSTRSKAVTIPISSTQSVASNQSLGEKRRVRFSTNDELADKPPALQTDKRHVFGGEGMMKDIEVPSIERKVSDLTDTLSEFDARSSVGSFIPRQDTILEEDTEERVSPVRNDDDHEEIKERDQLVQGSPVAMVHWSYREEGNITAVTPHLKGKSVSNATNSPFLRFKAAKTKFTSDNGKDSPVRRTSVPRKIKTRTGGVVSARINELNKRVSDVRKQRKKRNSHASSNGGGSRFVDNNNMIRTPLIMNYNPNAIGAGRFTLPIDQADESVVSCESEDMKLKAQETVHASKSGQETSASCSIFGSSQNYENKVEDDDEDDEADEDTVSRLSVGSSSIATIRQHKAIENFDSRIVTRPSIESATTHASTLSGLSSIRKQVFRSEVDSGASGNKSRVSLASSDGESTTLSSIMDKENATFLPFRAGANAVKPTEQNHPTAQQSLHLSPTQRTPAQARKWRSLAAAAHQKDANRKALLGKGKGSSGRPRKGLSARNTNQMAYVN